MLRNVLPAVLFCCACQLQAATLIEVKTPEGQTKIFRDGTRSRMDTGDGSYMVVDSKAQTLFVVMPSERQVMDMSQMLKMPASGQDNNPLDIQFEKQGSGPRIAGYKTLRYQYSANGKSCGMVLASEQALNDTDLQDTLEVMERMGSRADAMMQAFNRNADPCQRADTRFSEHARGIGMPMQITSSSGKLVSEIIRIETNAKLPPNAFAIPSGYQVQNVGQMMQQIPNMQDIMDQMQQPGQMSPETLQRLRR
jgi:hypothetical protein